MQVDGDFNGYVGARWPSLVRTLVLLGCPAALAPDVVATGLARCRRGWRAATEYDDLEVVVHRAVIEAWEERLRETWWSGLRPARDDEGPAADLSALDRLTPEVRAGLVLRRFAALDPAQAVGVAGPDAGGALPPLPDADMLRRQGESLVVYAPPEQDALPAVTPQWRSRRLVAVAGLLTVALALGGWTWWADRDAGHAPANDPIGLGALKPTRSRNPAGVAWYASGLLHLANATFSVPTLRDLASLGAGAVYGDDEGRVVHLADDGTRTLLGTKDPQVRLVASDEQGWVAWVDPAGANPRLLVYGVGQADLVGELDLPASRSGPGEESDTGPISIDGDTVYFATADGPRAWRPVRDPGVVLTVEPHTLPLLDVASRNSLYQLDSEQIRMAQGFFSEVKDVPGRGGEMSADGNYALTHNPADGAILVYDTRSAERIDVQLPASTFVTDVTLAPDGAITYLTVDPDAFPSQDGSDSNPVKGELVTCQLEDGTCESLATSVLTSVAPILAR